jgi:MraZ protein
MALLIGEFETTIDAKHRLAINASFREQTVALEDGENWILVLGPDRHLWLYPDLAYRKMLARLDSSPLPDRQTTKISLLFAMARYLKSDAQGRVVLPEKSMERAIVGERVTLVGMNDHIEIWPSDDWERYVKEQLAGYGEALYEAGERMKRSNQQQP